MTFLPKFLNFNISAFLKETNSPKVYTSAVFKQFKALTDKPNSVSSVLTADAYAVCLHQNLQLYLLLNLFFHLKKA